LPAATFAKSSCACGTATWSSSVSESAAWRFLIGVNIQKFKARFIEPMLSLAVAKLPEGPEWMYELKFDGYRALGLKSDGRVQLLSRNGKNFTERFASIARALESLPDETVIDGEIVAYGADGRPSFNVLQNRLSDKPQLHLYAFDLLALRGEDLTEELLEKRASCYAERLCRCCPIQFDIRRLSKHRPLK
jgi:ATP-dependent DNA ligase